MVLFKFDLFNLFFVHFYEVRRNFGVIVFCDALDALKISHPVQNFIVPTFDTGGGGFFRQISTF